MKAVDDFLSSKKEFTSVTLVKDGKPQFDHVYIPFPGSDFTDRTLTMLYDISVVLPEGIRFGYVWGAATISENTIGDPNVIFERQVVGNTR